MSTASEMDRGALPPPVATRQRLRLTALRPPVEWARAAVTARDGVVAIDGGIVVGRLQGTTHAAGMPLWAIPPPAC